MGFAALFCVFALNVAPWGIQSFHSFTDLTVKDVAISVPKMIATCPHHPDGCPKDCMCPKTFLTLGGHDDDERRASGSLHEPAWVTCSENGPESLSFSSAEFLPSTSGVDLIFAFVFLFQTRELFVPPNPLREPPQKIPIV